jgi:hypothetical protein
MTEVVKPKYLKATIKIELPPIEADAQAFGSYNPQEMADAYGEQLDANLIEHLEQPFVDETMNLEVNVEVVDHSPGV